MTSAFYITATDSQGAESVFALRATSYEAAVEAVLARGLLPLEVRSSRVGLRSTPRGEALVAGLRVLGELLEAGVPIGRAVQVVEENPPKRWDAVISAVKNAIERGEQPTTSIISALPSLPPVAAAVMQAGERAGDTAKGLVDAADMLEQDLEERLRLRGALAYPTILLGAGLISAVVVIVFVMPQLHSITLAYGTASNGVVGMLAGAGLAARSSWPQALGIVAVLVTAAVVWARSQWGTDARSRACLSLPGLRDWYLARSASRVARVCARLLQAGISVPDVLDEAANAAGDPVLARRLREARERVLHGTDLVAACRASIALPSTALPLLAAARTTQDLARLFDRIAEAEAARAERSVRTVVRLIEPSVVLAVAFLVGTCAMMLMRSVYGLEAP
ncbi:MAG: type II secretion system F family protein [Phycisphaerales bacterium JB038]